MIICNAIQSSIGRNVLRFWMIEVSTAALEPHPNQQLLSVFRNLQPELAFVILYHTQKPQRSRLYAASYSPIC